MAAYPTVTVPIQFLLQNPQNIQVAANMMNQLNTAMRNTQRSAVATMGSVNQVTRGVGAFFLLYKGLQLSNAAVKTGIDAAQDYELALTNLGIKTRATRTELAGLGNVAQDVALAIGPLTAVDVIRGMGQLSNTVGATVNRVAALAGPFSRFTSNVVELSEHNIAPEAAANIAARFLNLTGGIQDVGQAQKVLNALHGGIAAFSARDPQKLMNVLQPMTRSLLGKGVPLDTIMALGAIGTVMPQTARGGRDIRDFFDVMMTAGQSIKRGRAGASQLGAFRALGMVDAGGRPFIESPQTGAADIGRLLVNMQAHAQQILARPHGIVELNKLLAEALPAKLAKAFALSMIQSPGAFGQIAENIAHMPSIDSTLKILQRTTRVSMDQLITNFRMAMGSAFTAPSALLGRLARGGARGAAGLIHDMRAVPGLGPTLGFGTVAGAGGMSAMIMAMMFGGAGKLGVAGAGAIGTALGVGSTGLLIGAAIAAAISGGMLAYQHSAGFRNNVKDSMHLIHGVIHGGITAYNNSPLMQIAVNAIATMFSGFMDRLREALASAGKPEEVTPPGTSGAGGAFVGERRGESVAPFAPPKSGLGAPEPPPPATSAAPSRARQTVIARDTIDAVMGRIVQRLFDEHEAMSGTGAHTGGVRGRGIGTAPGSHAVY